MSKTPRLSPPALLLALLASGLLAASLNFPLWHIRMASPQYQGPEALRVEVLPGSMRGDLNEIRVLNRYIGVTVPDRLPQTRWLPPTLVLGAVLGVLAALLPLRARRFAGVGVAAGLALAMIGAVGQARWQMYHIGHDRNPHAALRGVSDFTPPLLGRLKLANFELQSGLGLGSFFIAGAIALYGGSGLLARAFQPSGRGAPAVELGGVALEEHSERAA